MRSADLVSSFGEIARVKDIDRDTLQLIVEDVMRAMIRKRYGSDEAFEIIFNPEQGDIQILHIREVVSDWDLYDPVTQIEESGALEIDDFFEVGDEVASELDIADFGRRAVMMGRQTFRQRIRDIEKEQIYEEYSELVGEIVVGEVYQVRRHETLLMHEGTELALPRNEQIPRDHYRKGNMLRTVVKEVMRDAGSDPQVIVSRTDPIFMERLFEVEVPEIYEGIVEIKEIARIPGDRAKVAVISHDERVDPVGACVGVKGVRIHAVVRELANENIDVLQWSDQPVELISRALSPANPVSVQLNEDEDPPRARVEVPADEVSQAIGRGGVNIRLASQLTEHEIDVYREIPADEEDIDIEEFGDELTEETIGKLRRIGCDTGKAVLELSVDELGRRANLDRDTANRVLDIIETEFEEGPGLAHDLRRGRFVIETPEGAGEAEDELEAPADEEELQPEASDENTEDENTDEPDVPAEENAELENADLENAELENADLTEEADVSAEPVGQQETSGEGTEFASQEPEELEK
jgi:transcription termination/antitermination protein NusA